MNTATRLDRLRYRATLYELALTKGETRILIAYTRPGRQRMFKACSDSRRARALTILAGSEDIHFAKTGEFASIGDWSVEFTGRTQREAIINGELPYCVDLVTEPAPSDQVKP